MTNQITLPVETPPETKPKSKLTNRKISEKPTEGSLTRIIGSGDDARNSFIWVTIKWSFIAAGLTTLAMYFRSFYFCDYSAAQAINDIKNIWSIFVPLITLALGYAFGKGR